MDFERLIAEKAEKGRKGREKTENAGKKRKRREEAKKGGQSFLAAKIGLKKLVVANPLCVFKCVLKLEQLHLLVANESEDSERKV